LHKHYDIQVIIGHYVALSYKPQDLLRQTQLRPECGDGILPSRVLVALRAVVDHWELLGHVEAEVQLSVQKISPRDQWWWRC
jgi:hypothetical protein